MDFKKLEKEIFDFVCTVGCAMTKAILADLDQKLHDERNKKQLRDKGKRKTTIKAMYGDVEIKRYFYLDENGEGVYLLDQEIGLDQKAGLFSPNVAEMIVQACGKMSFADAAEYISTHTGQDISKVGCWNIFQEIAARVNEEELFERANDTPEVLFEETDGVWVNTQDARKKSGSAEIKLATIYEGWEASDPDKLKKKTLIGGYIKAEDIRDKMETVKNKLYDVEKIQTVIVNGDGAGWIDNVEEGLAIRQLDNFHIQKYINRLIKDKKIQGKLRRALREKKTDRVLELIEMYINSLEGQDDKAVADAKRLYSYLDRGDEILSWMDRVTVPDPPEGTIYKRGGIQESQNTMISSRMKHGKKRWSIRGGCNMAKLLCVMQNGQLDKLIQKINFQAPDVDLPDPTNSFSAGRSACRQKKVGKGSKYVDVFISRIPSLGTANGTIPEMMRGIIDCSGYNIV